MKDYTQAELEAGGRPDLAADEALDFCLTCLYNDQQHRLSDELVRGLSFEELIGTLLQARDELQAQAAWDARQA